MIPLTFPVKSGQAANLHRDPAILTNLATVPRYQSEFYVDVPSSRLNEQQPPQPNDSYHGQTTGIIFDSLRLLKLHLTLRLRNRS